MTPTPPIRAVGIVVPAHDEQQLLPACLASLRVAARHPALRRVQVHLIPVLDACSDDSGAVAPGGLEVQARNVGVARTAGFAAALAREAGRASEQLWLATTDADSTVPADWLAEQLRLAALGVEVVAGTVRVQDWSEQPTAVGERFTRGYGAPGPGTCMCTAPTSACPPRPTPTPTESLHCRSPKTKPSSTHCAGGPDASSPPAGSPSPPAAGGKAGPRAGSPTICAV